MFVAEAVELEVFARGEGGLVLALYYLPDAKLRGFHFTQDDVADAAITPTAWSAKSGLAPKDVNGWLAFIDPFHLDGESWLRSWNQNYPQQPVYGGMAAGGNSGEALEPVTQLYLNGEVFEVPVLNCLRGATRKR